MARSRKIVIYVITKEKIKLPTTYPMHILYVPFSQRKKQEKLFTGKRRISTRHWIIADTLPIIEKANRADYKTILFANGKEKKWHIKPFSYPLFIVSSLEHLLNFLHLLQFVQ